jgi:hypothetical protein
MVNSDAMFAQHLTLLSRLPAVHLQASPCVHMPLLGHEGSCWSVLSGVVLCQWSFVLERACVLGVGALLLCWVREVVAVHLQAHVLVLLRILLLMKLALSLCGQRNSSWQLHHAYGVLHALSRLWLTVDGVGLCTVCTY